jgi:D-hydroxyproline dehydrogenase subunit beta
MKERITRETPELAQWGVHVMVAQTAMNELTIGDSHEYGLAVNILENARVNYLILDYATTYLRVPTLEISAYWHRVYAHHAERPYLRFTPASGVRVFTVTSGIGMTMAFGIVEQTFCETGAVA